MRYFRKEIPTRPISLPRGHRLEFEYSDRNQPGYYATEDAYIAAQLENAIANRVGGISEVQEAEYAEFQKKKQQESSFTLPPPQDPRGFQGPQLNRLNPGVRGPAAATSPSVQHIPNAPPPSRFEAQPKPVEVQDRFPKLGKFREKV